MTQQAMSKQGHQLLQEMENGFIEQKRVIGCLESDNIFDRAVGYEAVTNPKFRNSIQKLVPNSIYPKLCLQYLLECVSLDIKPHSDDLVHSQAEAFFELAVPMDNYWKENNAALDWKYYWGMISKDLVSVYPEYRDRLATHFLEGFPPDKPFVDKMGEWKENALLARYVEDLEKIVGKVF